MRAFVVVVLIAVTSLLGTGCKRKNVCLGTVECRDEGLCLQESKFLGPSSCIADETGCRASSRCAYAGYCGLDKMMQICAATRDADCLASKTCAIWGDCGVRAGSLNCEPTTDAHCQVSEVCRAFGRCSVDAATHKCVVKTDADCRGSSVCHTFGWCGVSSGGDCAPTTDAMCEGSSLCRGFGLCTAESGNCIGTSERACANSEMCKKMGVCTFVPRDTTSDLCVKTNDVFCHTELPYPSVVVTGGSDSSEPALLGCIPHCERRPPQPNAKADKLNPQCFRAPRSDVR